MNNKKKKTKPNKSKEKVKAMNEYLKELAAWKLAQIEQENEFKKRFDKLMKM